MFAQSMFAATFEDTTDHFMGHGVYCLAFDNCLCHYYHGRCCDVGCSTRKIALLSLMAIWP